MPLHAGEYAYYFDLGEFGTQMPSDLVELIERHDNGYWTVQYPQGYRLRKHADSLIGINDNRMLPWANKAEIIKTRNLASFADWRTVDAFRRNMATNNRSNSRTRRSSSRNRRSSRRRRPRRRTRHRTSSRNRRSSRRGGAINVGRGGFHIGQRVMVKDALGQLGPGTIVDLINNARGLTIMVKQDRYPGDLPGAFPQNLVHPLNNNAMVNNAQDY